MIKQFFHIVDSKIRLQAIRTEYKKLSEIKPQVTVVNRSLLVESQDYNIRKEFFQRLLNAEFEIANAHVAEPIIPQITQYINSDEETELDTIVETIEHSENKPFVCHNDDDDGTVADKRLAIESNVISEFIFKYGLETMQSLVEFKLEELKFSAKASPSECALQENWKGNYQPGTMLEREQVSAITKTLLGDSAEVKNHIIYQINLVHLAEAKNREANIKAALLQAKQGKPVALQLSDNSHWITLMLLPDKEDHNKINLVVMDSMKGGSLANSVVQQIKTLKDKIGVTVSEKYNLSVEGQQYSNNCGLATACNTASIFKTYELYEGNFEVAKFKAALEPNIYFHKKADGAYYCLGQHTNLVQRDIVERIGTKLLLRSATEQSLRNNNATKPEGELSDFFDKLAQEPKEQAKLKVVEERPLPPSELEKKLNEIINSKQAQKITARYLRENKIKEESTIQALEISEELKEKVKEVLQLAQPDKDISLGIINDFILWLANLLKWNTSEIFCVVRYNTDAKAFVHNWQSKIKADAAKKESTTALITAE